MSNMTVVVEFTAGTDIEDAVQEAREKALLWGVNDVKFNFNGVVVYVRGVPTNTLNTQKEWLKCCENRDTILFL